MFCCLASSNKDKKDNPKKTTQIKRGKVYLSLSPQLTFQLDQSCKWNFLGTQTKKTLQQQTKQIQQMRKKQKQMQLEIKQKQEYNKKLQKQKQKIIDQLNTIQEVNLKKKAHIAVLNYINLKEEAQIEKYRLKLQI